MVCPEEDGNEGQPHDAGRIHREPDVLCLVEVFRNFSAKQKNKVEVSLGRSTGQVIFYAHTITKRTPVKRKVAKFVNILEEKYDPLILAEITR